MKSFWNILTFLGLASCMTISCIRESFVTTDNGITVDDYLPEFTLTMNDGTEITTNNLHGKISVLIFFNTFCPDCQQELEIIQTLYETYTDNNNIIIVAISREQGYDSVLCYWENNHLSVPFSAQSDNKIYHLFANSGIPRIYISDDKLKIQALFTDSENASVEHITTVIERLQSEIFATR